uniref:non-specific serine/threonine protein kinase n=1 Tax=Oryza glaberrima TaxID=4538 RepID=I1Q7T9_ORYGL
MAYEVLHPCIFLDLFLQVRQTSRTKFCFLFLLVSFGINCASFTNTSGDQLLYLGFTGANLITDDTTVVTSNGLLELTNGTVNRKGHAFYPSPLHFRKSHNNKVCSFSVSFVFAIRSSYPRMSLHGLAFVVSPSINFSNALASQYLGFLNSQNKGKASNYILAIEFDTVLNIEFEDIDNNHVGIDINDLHSVKSHSAGYYDDRNSIFHNMSLISGDPMQAWVDYNGEDKKINVTMAPIKMAKPTKPLISISYDLSTVLKEPSYIGFSASTGASDSRHYILGWSFGMNKSAPMININKLPKLPYQGSNPQSKLLAITLPIASATFVILLCSVFIITVQRRLTYAELKEDWEAEFGPHRFSYKDLFHATHGFDNKNLLGAGGFGKVYKGVLPSSKLEVAVKRVSHESRQGMKEFVAEVVSIGRIRHRNIVQLLGYCRRKGELLLVYDYMTNGSLDTYLYNNELKPTLSWDQRFRIIKGIASGLFYLHDKWEKVVIHRDIKASNVLLDTEMNGRLGDFGLARLYDHGTDLQTTHVVGTMGYLAPELVCTGKASPLTDVFAFGAFLLEVTCGQRPVNHSSQDSPGVLVDWVLEHWQKGLLTNTVDARLQGDYNIDEACFVLKLGLLCSHPFTNMRPNMQQVMQFLDGDVPLPELTHMDMSFSIISMMQDEGFNPYTLSSYPPPGTSVGTISNISGGR